jgi:hypothetical protein
MVPLMKYIQIDDCKRCPWRSLSGSNRNSDYSCYAVDTEPRQIDCLSGIPNWCPLGDLPTNANTGTNSQPDRQPTPGLDREGITKAIEECAELTQVLGKLIQTLAKKSAFMGVVIHPDGSNLNDLIRDESADTLASVEYMIDRLNLSKDEIAARKLRKLQLYNQWQEEDKRKLWGNHSDQ